MLQLVDLLFETPVLEELGRLLNVLSCNMSDPEWMSTLIAQMRDCADMDKYIFSCLTEMIQQVGSNVDYWAGFGEVAARSKAKKAKTFVHEGSVGKLKSKTSIGGVPASNPFGQIP